MEFQKRTFICANIFKAWILQLNFVANLYKTLLY